jgi:hypothetical protein
MKFIEMMGLPAAGKSTFAARLRKEGLLALEDAYWRASRACSRGVLEKGLAMLPDAMKTPLSGAYARMDMLHLFLTEETAYAAFILKEAAAKKDALLKQSFLHAWLEYAAKKRLIIEADLSGGPVLVEEGFSQRIMTLFGYDVSLDASAMAACISSMPKPDALIWVNTDPHRCADRLSQRADRQVAFRDLPPDQWNDQLKKAQEVLRVTASMLGDAGVDVIEINEDSEVDAGTLVRRLISFG